MARKRPRQQRFDDPLLDICWAAVATLDEGRKYTLLQEVATDMALDASRRRAQKDKVAAAIVSLRVAADLLGHPPTLSEYRALRAANAELKLVSDGRCGVGWGCRRGMTVSRGRCSTRSPMETS